MLGISGYSYGSQMDEFDFLEISELLVLIELLVAQFILEAFWLEDQKVNLRRRLLDYLKCKMSLILDYSWLRQLRWS